jgi:predicted transcriptional regulator
MTNRTPANSDRHRSGFLVRLPPILRMKLQELKAARDRPMTALVVDAVVQYLTAEGHWTQRDQQALDTSNHWRGHQ